MPKFIREYVHCLMDNSLIGKTGFFADDASVLKYAIKNNSLTYCGCLKDTDISTTSFPFYREDNESCYKFFYHDPYWDLKVSVENGDGLERNVNGKWVEVLDLKGFLSNYNQPAPPEEYRTVPKGIPVDRIVFNLELAKWLADGHGQALAVLDAKSVACTDYHYSLANEHMPVQGVLVRAWGDTEWVVPTASYLGLERGEYD